MKTPFQPCRRARARGGDRGFTLVELIIAIVLSAMIGGVVVMALVTSLNVASSATAQVGDSTDAGLISAFLVRDAQSAGGIDPATALADNTLGVSNDTGDTDGVACTSAPSEVKLRLSWMDRSVSPENKVVVTYAQVTDPADSTKVQLVRRVCTNNGTTTAMVDVVLGLSILDASATCAPDPSPLNCTGQPDTVTLTVTGKGTRAPLVSIITASLRSAVSQLTIVGSPLPPGQLGANYPTIPMTTIGAALPITSTTWSATGMPPGLEISPSGVVSGIPTLRGVYSSVAITATDASGATATRTYKMIILAPPEAVADVYTVDEDSTLNVPASGVLANDTSDSTKTAILYSGVANGALTFTSDGSFIYSPRSNFNGTDAFKYKLNDGALDSNIVTVTLTVNSINDPPVNRIPVAQQTWRNTSKVFLNSSRISISDVDAASAIVQVQLNAVNGTVSLPNAPSSAGNGTARVTVSGTIAEINLSLVNATFTPYNEFVGAAVLQMVSSDLGNSGAGGALGDTDSVNIAVTNNVLGVFSDKKDVSQPFKPGDSTYSDPIYTVSNGKGGVQGNSDGFQFLYRSMTGDGRLTARVVSIDSNSQGAQAGVMFRETLGVDSIHATIDVTKSGQAGFLYRLGTGQPTSSVSYPGANVPYWLRVTRSGNLFTAERSADGVTWVTSTPTTITMAPTIYVGLAVASQNNSSNLATAIFDQVAVTTPPIASGDAYSVNEDTTLSIDALNGVLDNDSDPEGDALSAVTVSGLTGLTLNSDGSFAYVPPSNFAGTVSFTYVANDGALNSAPATVTITVNPSNETPSFIKGADQIIAPDTGATVVAGWATAISQGSGETGQLIDFIVTNSNPSFFSLAPVLSADGTLSYGTAAGASGAVTVSVSIHDNGGTTNGGADTSAIQTFIIKIDAPPVLAGTVAALPYPENGTTAVDAGITVVDGDSATLSSATVTMTAGYVNGEDTLTFVSQNGIVGTWTASTGVLGLSGSATVANYQAALRSVTYTNNSQTPTGISRSVAFVVNDGIFDSNTTSRTISVNAVNDAPINSVPTSQSTLRNTTKVFSSANGNLISISDLDAGAGAMRVQLVTTSGSTTLSGIAGLTFTAGDGTADATMTFTGTITSVNSALAGLSFIPTAAFVGTANLQIVTNDQGNTGTGGALGDTDNISIVVGDAPVVTTTVAGLVYTENATTAVDSSITVTDIDSANLTSARVTMTTAYVNGQDSLLFTNQLGIIGVWDAPTGILTLTGATTKANYQTALRTVRYTNNSNSPNTTTRTVTFVANDGLYNSNTASRTIIVTAVNDAPVVGGTTGSLAYIENGTTVVVPAITVIDADTANLSSATVRMTTSYLAAQDSLALVAQNGITATWTSATGILALSGSATVANYEAALRSITYTNISNAPTLTTRTVTFLVNDGILNSNTATRTITLTAVNDAPVNSVPAGPHTMPRNTIKIFSSVTANLVSISDIDASTGVVQVQLISTLGTVTLPVTTGLTIKPGDSFTADADMTFTGTIANINARLNGLRFNAANVAGSANLRIVTSDQGLTGGGILTDADNVAITLT